MNTYLDSVMSWTWKTWGFGAVKVRWSKTLWFDSFRYYEVGADYHGGLPTNFKQGHSAGKIYRSRLMNYARSRFRSLGEELIIQQVLLVHGNKTKCESIRMESCWTDRFGEVNNISASSCPDLTAWNFVLWIHIKRDIYKTLMEYMEELKRKTRAEMKRNHEGNWKAFLIIWTNV